MIGKFELLLNIAIPEKPEFRLKFYFLLMLPFQRNDNHAIRLQFQDTPGNPPLRHEKQFIFT